MGKKTSVEIVIPVYNEEMELEDNIGKLHSFLTKHLSSFPWHITIADNASTDASFSIAKKLSKKYPEVGVFHLPEKGRGRAVKAVWSESRADILAYMDVDLSTRLESIDPLITALAQGYDIAIGSRLLPTSTVVKRPLKREILSRGYNLLIKLLFSTKFSDAQCGFKGITRKAAGNLLPYIADNEWFFDSELLIISEKLGYKVYEEPVYWVDNPGSTVRVLKTVTGDVKGLLRLWLTRPWKGIKKI